MGSGIFPTCSMFLDVFSRFSLGRFKTKSKKTASLAAGQGLKKSGLNQQSAVEILASDYGAGASRGWGTFVTRHCADAHKYEKKK